MKRFLILLFTLTLIFNFTVSAVNAQGLDNSSDDGLNKNVENAIESLDLSDENQVKVTPITEEQAIQILIEKAGMLPLEAEQMIYKNDDSYSLNSTAGKLYQLTATKDFGCGYEVEAGCIARRSSGMGPLVWTEIINTWTIASGSGFYTWVEAYVLAEIEKPPIDILLAARGTIEVAVDTKVSGSATLKKKLLGAGFTLSGSVGSTYYYRKIATWAIKLG